MNARRVLLVTFVFVGVLSSATPPQAQNKAACDLIPLADVSAAFGQEMFLRPRRGMGPEYCNYMNVGPFDRPKPGQTQVSLNISFQHEAKPDPDAVVDAARVLKQQRQIETTAVSGLGDAAFWYGNDLSGELVVFRGGTETLTISGQLSLDKMKALVAKAFGGTGRTGFAYGGKPSTFDVSYVDTPIVGGASFSQALYITQSEFLKQVKEVSLNIAASESPMKAVSPADQRSLVTKALSARGISVRAGAPVVALATFDQHDSVGTVTKTYTSGRTEVEKFYIHNVFVSLDLYTRAVVMRGGQAHVVTAAPARAFHARQYVEDNEIRKTLFGDETVADMKDLVSYLVDESLEDIATNHAVDSTPWYANAWTAAQKASADAEFLRLMNTVPSETRALAGITAPQVETIQPATDDPEEACPEPKSWRQNWTLEIQRKRWPAQTPAPFTVRHTFRCRHAPVFRFGGYYRLVDDVSLREANAVFVLNGRVFRKPATLASAHRILTDQGENLDSVVQRFVPQSVLQFSGLIEGALSAPNVAPAAVRIAAGTASTDDAQARAGKHVPDTWERTWNAPFYTASQYDPSLARKGRMVLEGTVASVKLEGSTPQWLRIYFKEAPANVVNVCTPSPDIFSEFGSDYRGLVGRRLRVAGDIDGLCIPKGGIRVVESNQAFVHGAEPRVP